MPQSDLERTAGAQRDSRGALFSFESAYSRFALVLLVISVVTLLPHYHEILSATTPVSASLIAHGVLFLAWYVLFFVQSALVSARQLALHKRLGYMSVALTVVLVYSGSTMLLNVVRSFEPGWSEQYLLSRTSFVWAIYHTLASFVGFYVLGVLYRMKSQLHRRFMLMASLSMMSASITRVAFLPFIPMDGTALTLLCTYALLITPLLMDWVQTKSIHPVFRWATPVYVISQLFCIAWLPTTEAGRSLAFPI